ncbi:MAG: CDP-glucose 4,6-dehydratase [Polaromonas sp.]|nr:CDP-glucose 4,6-dehydratase [Polaromonas sp.]
MLPGADFWHGRRVLLTGHTGFKGAWLALWLNRLGARVVGISLPPSTQPNLFDATGLAAHLEHHVCDIRDAGALANTVRQSRPEVVFHLAAQALVRQGYRTPVETFSTNVMGTAHLLDALRGLDSVRAVVAVTTDKVYRNLEWPYPYREDDALGGHDPYSASKAASELVIASYRASWLEAQQVAVASARAGNVIGGGDWSDDRLIPDAVRAWAACQTLQVRRPQAIRPWQHVLEPICAYLRLAEQLWARPVLAGAYNFGPRTDDAATVGEVIRLAQGAWGGGDVVWGDGTEGPHEAGWLALEIAKARTALGVQPRWALQEAVARSLAWYVQHGRGASALDLCEADIAAYETGAVATP